MNKNEFVTFVAECYQGEIGAFSPLKEVKKFGLDDMPTIYIPNLNGTMAYTLNLNELRSELEGLTYGEYYIIGRDPRCNHRWGLSELKAVMEKDGKTEEQVELFYMHHARQVSRIHCVLKKEANNTFILYDRSYAGLRIAEMNVASPTVPAPKGFWERLKQAFGG